MESTCNNTYQNSDVTPQKNAWKATSLSCSNMSLSYLPSIPQGEVIVCIAPHTCKHMEWALCLQMAGNILHILAWIMGYKLLATKRIYAGTLYLMQSSLSLYMYVHVHSHKIPVFRQDHTFHCHAHSQVRMVTYMCTTYGNTSCCHAYCQVPMVTNTNTHTTMHPIAMY